MKRLFLLIASGLILTFNINAQESDEDFDAVPEPPELPDPLVSGQPIEPDVTIIRNEKEVIEEYRLNGNLFQVKITPVIGPSYYLIDMDGDGQLESRRTGIYDSGNVPKWVLFSW
jgi:hypothetical protein